MAEQSQPIVMDQFPCLCRLLTFLANSGMRPYTLHFSWSNQDRWLSIPLMTPVYQEKGEPFGAGDEANLRQLEQSSLSATLFVADVAGCRLELDHGYYRLRYSLLATGRRQLIRDLLAEKGILQYEFVDETSEGRDLPPYRNFAEIEDCSAIVVTPTKGYHFWLSWANGRHTLGEEMTFFLDGKQWSFWHEFSLDDLDPHHHYPGFVQAVEGARRCLHLRRPVERSQVEETDQMWELREEDANQCAHRENTQISVAFLLRQNRW